MENPAPVDNPVHEVIQRRWSPSAFGARAVEPAVLRSLLEAARWAPSSYNEQPWAFIVANRDQPDDFDLLLACLAPGNQAWAGGAPVLVLSVAKMTFDHNGKPNRHAFHDVGLASTQIALQATALGLGVHFMAGFDGGRARDSFAIPEGFEPVAAIAIGYAKALDDLTGDQRRHAESPRQRRPIGDFVYAGTWGTAAALTE
jgi:nitroreductase